MSARVVFHRCNDFETTLHVEVRGLKRKRGEQNHSAAAPLCLLFSSGVEPRAETLPTQRLMHPELANVKAAAPERAGDAGDDAVVRISDEDREPFAIMDAGCERIEIVDSIFEKLNFARRRIRADDKFHGVRRPRCREAGWIDPGSGGRLASPDGAGGLNGWVGVAASRMANSDRIGRSGSM